MLDNQMIDQLKGVFSKLEKDVELVFDHSENEKQKELVELLEQLGTISDHIRISPSGESSETPRFFLRYDQKPNGISFRGIPGGHEFSSLVLAILNSDKKGKLPDQALIHRIARLKGPIHLRTYISLTCENCPDVVQALNLISVLHPQFSHEMIDGGFVPEEIDQYNIQGVPSVMVEGDLVSAGKASFIELLEKLEEKFGVEEDSVSEDIDLGLFDVVIVGGGPAGASAAIYSARKGLKTAIIADRFGGQLQDTKGIENLISVPYTEGPQLAANLAKHMSDYDIQLLEHRRVASIENGPVKTLVLSSKEKLQTKSLIIATGAKWRELGVNGEKEYLGRGVAFCPHCDGPYYKGKDIAVVGGGNSGVEAAIDLAGIVKSITLLEFSNELKADQVLVDKLSSLSNVKIIKNARTSQVLGNGDKVTGLEYEDRTTEELKQIQLDGIFVQIGLIPNSGFLNQLVEINRYGEIVIDEKCRTNVPGIYAAGDVTTVPYKQIVVAMSEGSKAALAAFEDQMVS